MFWQNKESSQLVKKISYSRAFDLAISLPWRKDGVNNDLRLTVFVLVNKYLSFKFPFVTIVTFEHSGVKCVPLSAVSRGLQLFV